jgi:hypothetical protein
MTDIRRRPAGTGEPKPAEPASDVRNNVYPVLIDIPSIGRASGALFPVRGKEESL